MGLVLFKTVIAGMVATILWLSAAFIVAFPKLVFSLDFSALSKHFITGFNNESIFIPLLLFVDIIIAVMLHDLRLNKVIGFLVLASALVYVSLTFMVPEYSGEQTSKTYGILFGLAFACLAVPRFFTLVTAEQFRRIEG